MEHTRLEKQVQFILEVDRLKEIFRQTVCTQSRRAENDAEHSWHICLAVIVLAGFAAGAIDWRTFGQVADETTQRGDPFARGIRRDPAREF